MAEYRVQWCRYPLNHHDSQVLFVETNTPDNARILACDFIERKHHVARHDFCIEKITEAETMPDGTVKES